MKTNPIRDSSDRYGNSSKPRNRILGFQKFDYVNIFKDFLLISQLLLFSVKKIIAFDINRKNLWTKAIVRILPYTFLIIYGTSLADNGSLLIPDSQPKIIYRNGQPWLSMDDMPKFSTTAQGMPLGKLRFVSLSESPDGLRVALAVAGANHQWVAIVNTANKMVSEIAFLYGGGINQFLWSPNGEWLAINIDEASGASATLIWSRKDYSVKRVNNFFEIPSAPPSCVSNPVWTDAGQFLEFSVTIPCEGMSAKTSQGISGNSSQGGNESKKYRFSPNSGDLTVIGQ